MDYQRGKVKEVSCSTADIDPEIIEVLLGIEERGGFCAGGFARTFASDNKEYNDIDIYCENEESRDNIRDYLMKVPYVIYYSNSANYGVETENYNILARTWFFKKRLLGKLQLVKDICGTREQIIKDFDITICQAALDVKNSRVRVTDEFLEDEKEKRLRFLKVKESHGFYIWIRLDKYINKGYNISDNELIKLFSMIEDRSMFINVLLQDNFFKDNKYPKFRKFLKLAMMDHSGIIYGLNRIEKKSVMGR